MDVRRAKQVVELSKATRRQETVSQAIDQAVQRYLVELRLWQPPALTPREKKDLAEALLAIKRAKRIDFEQALDVVKLVAIGGVGLVLAMGGLHQLFR